MNDELSQINETLKNIERKLKDNFSSPWVGLIDFEKIQERSRKEREEERNEEILKIQKDQSKMIGIQTESIRKQENFNKIVAFTGSVLALIGIYSFLDNLILQKVSPEIFWTISIIFLTLTMVCLGPLIAFVVDHYKEWIFGK